MKTWETIDDWERIPLKNLFNSLYIYNVLGFESFCCFHSWRFPCLPILFIWVWNHHTYLWMIPTCTNQVIQSDHFISKCRVCPGRAGRSGRFGPFRVGFFLSGPGCCGLYTLFRKLPSPKSKQCLENISFGGWISERCAPLIQPQKVNNAWKILVLGVGSRKDVLPWSNPKK